MSYRKTIRAGTTSDRILQEIRARKRFTQPELVAATGASAASVGRLVWELLQKGAVECETAKRNGHRGGVAVYLITQEPVPATGDARGRVWRAIRISKRFTLAELIATAEAGESNALRFVLELERAGIVRRDVPRRSGIKGGGAIYRLVNDSGPETPRFPGPDRRGKQTDMNDKTEILSPDQAAAMIGNCTRTLRRWRRQGLGPVFVQYGRRPTRGCVKYLRRDVAKWLREQRVEPDARG